MNTTDSHHATFWPGEALWRWLVLGAGVVVALFTAYWVGTNDVLMLLLGLAVIIVALVVGVMRERAWVLIPCLWLLSRPTALMRIPLSGRDLAIILATAGWVGYRIVSGVQRRPSWHKLDTALVLVLLQIGLTFVRHPVGLSTFGASMIGGRPYFTTMLAVVAYWVILQSPTTARRLSLVPFYLLVGSAVLALLSAISYFLPALRDQLTLLYAALDVSAYFSDRGLEAVVPRYSELDSFGRSLIMVLCAYFSTETMFNPLRWRSYLFGLGWICTLLSGFRSAVLWNVATITVTTWLHRGWGRVLGLALAGLVVLGLLGAGQGRLYELPLSMQRALSFLPGRWSPLAQESAERSSADRFEWWKAIVRGNIIKSWVWGDGFGFDSREQESLRTSGDFYTAQTVYGTFHNGPLSTIRYVGCVGLALYYFYMILAAVHAVRTAQAARGTELFPLAVFLAAQLVWAPVHFTFVFGAYEAQLPQQIFLVALLRKLQEQLAEPAAAPANQARPASTTGGNWRVARVGG